MAYVIAEPCIDHMDQSCVARATAGVSPHLSPRSRFLRDEAFGPRRRRPARAELGHHLAHHRHRAGSWGRLQRLAVAPKPAAAVSMAQAAADSSASTVVRAAAGSRYHAASTHS